jgi:Calcineurin-like phosphoesterase
MDRVIVPYASIEEAFDRDSSRIEEAVHAAADKAANGDPAKRADYIARWNAAMSAMERDDHGEEVMSSPRDPLASRLQSVLARQATQEDKVRTVQPAMQLDTPVATIDAPQIRQVKFDNADLAGWIGMAWKLIFRPERAPWKTPPTTPETLADDARIAVFSDWATGLYGAPEIGRSIEKMSRCDVVLHLGDTYYSGADDEVQDRLVGSWPRRPSPTVNRALNGNHEMYSGGKGYFGALESFFRQPASCFAMQNAKWLLIGLDTAYENHNFEMSDAQVAWVESMVAAAGKRKLLLFSHHQPFSPFETQGEALQKELRSLLDRQRIHAWWWGHEHRLILFEAHSKWGFKGRCMGHGGFPEFRDSVVSGGDQDLYQWVTLKKRPYSPAAKMLDGPNFWIPNHERAYGAHGYLTLQFDGDTLWEVYHAPNGIAVSERLKV